MIKKTISYLKEKFYAPSEYVSFNEGITKLIFLNNRFLRLLFGWKPISWIFFNLFETYKIKLGERLFELPTFWIFLGEHNSKIKKVLDFGCAESRLSLNLSSLGYEVIGIDLRNYEYGDILDNFTFVQGDLFEKYKNLGKFDLITAISSVEHVGLDVYGNDKFSINNDNYSDIHIMKIFYELLNNGGLLYLTVPFGDTYEVKKTYRIYNEKKLNELIKGFTVIRKRIFNVPDNSKWSKDCDKIWCGLLQK